MRKTEGKRTKKFQPEEIPGSPKEALCLLLFEPNHITAFEEAAEALGLSARTADNYWAHARACLFQELKGR